MVVGEGRTSLADPHAVSQDATLVLALWVLLWRVARRPHGIDASDEAEGRRLVRQRDESFLPAVRDEHLKAQGYRPGARRGLGWGLGWMLVSTGVRQ